MSRLATHQRQKHQAELDAIAVESHQKAFREKVSGAIRTITDSAMEEFGLNDNGDVLMIEGQAEMNRRREANFAQFVDPPKYDKAALSYQADSNDGTDTLVPIEIPPVDVHDKVRDERDVVTAASTRSPTRHGRSEYTAVECIMHPSGGKAFRSLKDSERVFKNDGKPFAPFDNPYDFKVGKFLLRAGASDAFIRRGFNSSVLHRYDFNGVHETKISSAYSLKKKVDKLAPELGESSWKFGEAVFWADDKRMFQPFHYRDPIVLMKYLFAQPAYKNHISYKPVREYNESGRRVYSEINSGTWMWNKQKKIPEGGTVVPLLFTSDQTKLTTHVGDQYFWPLFMSIGNIHSTVRNQPSNNAWVLLAQLPVPPPKRAHNKYKETKGAKLDKDGFSKTQYESLYKSYKEDALGSVIERIFAPLKDLVESKEGIELFCCDGNLRKGYPFTAAWLADFQEYNKLYGTHANGCCLCEVSHSQLGDNFLGTRRDSDQHNKALQLLSQFNLYHKRLTRCELPTENVYWKEKIKESPREFPATKKGLKQRRQEVESKIEMAKLYFECRQAKPIDNALWKTGVAEIQDVWKPDLLHTIYEGMVLHVFHALQQFLTKHHRLDRFEEAWMRVPAFGQTPAPKRSIFEVAQRTGKALRDALHHLLPVLTIALDHPTAAEHMDFLDCQEACRYLVDFSLVCQYKFHTEVSLTYLREYLDGFHRHKSVFNEFRPMPSAGDDDIVTVDFANRREPFKKDTLPSGPASKARQIKHKLIATEEKQKAISTLQNIAQKLFVNDRAQLEEWLGVQEIHVQEVLDILEGIAVRREQRFLDHGAYWKIPKLHLLSHFAETITEFGYLQQFSSEVGEFLHKGIKEAFRRSSNNNPIPQILQFHTRKYAIRMRELNLEQLARDKVEHQEDIQEALMLYGDKQDRLTAARLNRKGQGGIRHTSYYRKQAKRARRIALKSLDATADSTNHDPDTNQVPSDAPFYIPAPLPLFQEVAKFATGRRFRGKLKNGFNTVQKLSDGYDLPKLADALLYFLINEHDYPADLVREDVADFETTAWHSLLITNETFQSVDPIETHKCVCSGPYRAPHSNTPRNDTILFTDKDEYWALTEKDQSLMSDFGLLRVARLKCLFQVKVPKIHHLATFFAADGRGCPDSFYQTHNVALVHGYQPERYDDFGEMVPGTLVGRCIEPQHIADLRQTQAENLKATHITQRKNDGRVFDIGSILRGVQIIAQHDENEKRENKRKWVVNNRTDLGIWDYLYSKTTELRENFHAVG